MMVCRREIGKEHAGFGGWKRVKVGIRGFGFCHSGGISVITLERLLRF